MTGTPLLEVDGIHTYYGESHVLHGVSFTIHRGQTLCLMGRNGMGKTTTVRSIFGLTPPRRGRVRINGREVTAMPPHRTACLGVALVPEGRGIFPNLTVRENLVMAARPGCNGARLWTLEKVLDMFPRLAERITSYGDHLSGGEQQMLAIGRALMTNPDLLVLDEATEGLAPLIRKEIWAVIRAIKAEGVATLIIDKDVKSLLSVSDHCIILSKGRVVYGGSADELAQKPEIHQRYLGV